MTIHKLLLAAASVAAILPAVSHATPENTALRACAQAFASSLASGSGVPAYKLKYLNSSVGALADYYGSREYTFYLQARNPQTGLTLARATCSADARGAVVLKATPPGGSPALAAQF